MCNLLLGGSSLGHGVEGGTVLEPLDLGSVEGVGQRDLEGLVTVLGVDNHGDGLSDGELGGEDIDL